MALTERQLLDALSRTPFVDSTELALILGEPHTTVHRTLGSLTTLWLGQNRTRAAGGSSAAAFLHIAADGAP